METTRDDLLKYAWLVLLLAVLVNATPIILENRTEPLLPLLMDAFQINFEQAGYMKSVAGLTGLIMLLPAGLVIQRYGNRSTGLFALLLLFAGAVLGALTPNYELLLVGLFIEGVSGAMLAVLATNLVLVWFPVEKRGLPMGFVTASLNIGILLGVMGAPGLLNLSFVNGWRGVWWVEAGLVLVVFVLFALFYRPDNGAAGFDSDTGQASSIQMKHILKNSGLLLVGLTVFIFTFSYTASNFFPAYLITEKDFSPERAGGMISIASFAGMLGGPLAGWLSDRLKTRKWVTLTGIIISLPFLFSVMLVPERYYPLYMLWAGFAAGVVFTPLLSGIPELVKDQKNVGLAIAVFWMFNYFAILVANPILGGLLDRSGWITTLNVSGGIGTLGIVVILLNRRLK